MTITSETRKPYSGNTRSLVLAFDVGTTFSGVSYAILEPNEIPKIHCITRCVLSSPRAFCPRISLPLSSFPGQEHVAGSYKIPTILYYNKDGNVEVAGAEAEGNAIMDLAEDNGWIKAELYVLCCSCHLKDSQYYQHRFKLRLRPQTMKLQMNGMRLPPLPKGKTAVQVFGDYLGYLFRCTKNFIVDTHANGASLWRAIEEDLQLVLSHPNGWEGAQQTKMRRAAVYGGLIPDTDAGKARIRFVTEGEASLHACVLNGLAKEMLTVQAFPYSLSPMLIPVISGPSRAWVSRRGCRRRHPRHQFIRRARNCPTRHGRDRAARLSVIIHSAPPFTHRYSCSRRFCWVRLRQPKGSCVLRRSVVLSQTNIVLNLPSSVCKDKLRNSKYGTQDTVEHITKRFDETTKRLFRDKKEPQYVLFGSPLDKDPSVGIRQGQLKLTG